MKNILSICNPPITTYQRIAFPLSIAMQSNNAYNWFYSNYIQLMCANQAHHNLRSPQDNTLHLDFYTPDLSELAPLEHITIDSNSQLIALGNFDFIRQFISQGYYIYTDVDKFYIPHTPSYKKHHYCHDILINGYDDEMNLYFYSYGEYKLCQNAMSFDEFYSGYFSEHCNETHYRTRAILYRPIVKEHCIDFHKIIFHMREYLAGVETFAREHSNVFHPDSLSAIGIDVYNEFIRLCDKLSESENIYMRRNDAYCLYEHKKIMADRITYLAEQGIANADSKLLLQFRELEKIAQQIMLLNLKLNALHDSRNSQIALLHRIKDHLNELRTNEITTWTMFLNANQNSVNSISNEFSLNELVNPCKEQIKAIDCDSHFFQFSNNGATSIKQYLVLKNNQPLGLVALYNIDNKNSLAEFEFALNEKEVSLKDFKAITNEISRIAFNDLKLNKIIANVIRDNYLLFDLFRNSDFVFEAIHRDQFIDSHNKPHDVLFFSLLKFEWIQHNSNRINVSSCLHHGDSR